MQQKKQVDKKSEALKIIKEKFLQSFIKLKNNKVFTSPKYSFEEVGQEQQSAYNDQFQYHQIYQSTRGDVKKYMVTLEYFQFEIEVYFVALGSSAKYYDKNLYPKYGKQYILFPTNKRQFHSVLLKASLFKIVRILLSPLLSPTDLEEHNHRFDLIIDSQFQNSFIPTIIYEFEPKDIIRGQKIQQKMLVDQCIIDLKNKLGSLCFLLIIDIVSFIVFRQSLSNSGQNVHQVINSTQQMEENNLSEKQKYFVYISGISNSTRPHQCLQSEIMQAILNPSFNLLTLSQIHSYSYARFNNLSIKQLQLQQLDVTSAFNLIAQIYSPNSKTSSMNKQQKIIQLYQNKKYNQLTKQNRILTINLLTTLHSQMNYQAFSILRDKIIKLSKINQQPKAVESNVTQEIPAKQKKDEASSPLTRKSTHIELKKRRSYSQSQKDKQIYKTLNLFKIRPDNKFPLKQKKHQQSFNSSQSISSQWSDDQIGKNRCDQIFQQHKSSKAVKFKNKEQNMIQKQDNQKIKLNKKWQNNRFQTQFSYLFKRSIQKQQKQKQKQKQKQQKIKIPQKKQINKKKYHERTIYLLQQKTFNPSNMQLYLIIRFDQSFMIPQLISQLGLFYATLELHTIARFTYYFNLYTDPQFKLKSDEITQQKQNNMIIMKIQRIVKLFLTILFIDQEIINKSKIQDDDMQKCDKKISIYSHIHEKMVIVILLCFRYNFPSRKQSINRLLQLQKLIKKNGEFLIRKIHNQHLTQIRYIRFYQQTLNQRNLLFKLQKNQCKDYYHPDNQKLYNEKIVNLYQLNKKFIHYSLQQVQKKGISSIKQKKTTQYAKNQLLVLSYIKICVFYRTIIEDIYCFFNLYNQYMAAFQLNDVIFLSQNQLSCIRHCSYNMQIFSNSLITQHNKQNRKLIKDLLTSSVIFKCIVSLQKNLIFTNRLRSCKNSQNLSIDAILNNIEFNRNSFLLFYSFIGYSRINEDLAMFNNRYLYNLQKNIKFFSCPILYMDYVAYIMKCFHKQQQTSPNKDQQTEAQAHNKQNQDKHKQMKIQISQKFENMLDNIKIQITMNNNITLQILQQILFNSFNVFQYYEYRLEVEDVCIQYLRKQASSQLFINNYTQSLIIIGRYMNRFKRFQEVFVIIIQYCNAILDYVEQIYQDEELQKYPQRIKQFQNIQYYLASQQITEQLFQNKQNKTDFYIKFMKYFITHDTFYFIQPQKIKKSKFRQQIMKLKRQRIQNKKLKRQKIKLQQDSALGQQGNQQQINRLPFQATQQLESVLKFGKKQFNNFKRLNFFINHLKLLNGIVGENNKESYQRSQYLIKYYKAMNKFKIQACIVQCLRAKIFMQKNNIEFQQLDHNEQTSQYMKQLYLRTKKFSYICGFVLHLELLWKKKDNTWVELLQEAFQNQYIKQNQYLQNQFCFMVQHLPSDYYQSLIQKMKTRNLILFLAIQFLKIQKTTEQNSQCHLKLIKQTIKQLYLIRKELFPQKLQTLKIKLSYLLAKIYKFINVKKCVYFFYKYQRSLKHSDLSKKSLKISIYHHLHKIVDNYGGVQANYSRFSIKKSLIKNICPKCQHIVDKNLQPFKVSIHLRNKIKILEAHLQIIDSNIV